MDVPFSLEELRQRLRDEGVSPRAVDIDGSSGDECYCLLESPTHWEYFYSERGHRNGVARFQRFVEAAEYFLEKVLGDPTTRR